MDTLDKEKTIQLAQAVIREESNAVLSLCARVNDDFVTACQHLLNCTGRIVVLGIGKSGHMDARLPPHWPALAAQHFLSVQQKLLMVTWVG